MEQEEEKVNMTPEKAMQQFSAAMAAARDALELSAEASCLACRFGLLFPLDGGDVVETDSFVLAAAMAAAHAFRGGDNERALLLEACKQYLIKPYTCRITRTRIIGVDDPEREHWADALQYSYEVTRLKAMPERDEKLCNGGFMDAFNAHIGYGVSMSKKELEDFAAKLRAAGTP